MPAEFTYDVFISHHPAERDWVRGDLLPALEGAGLHVCLPERDFEIGLPTLVATERAVDGSRHTLVVITPDWLASAWNDFETLLVSSADPAGRRRRLIPLLLKPTALPARIDLLTRADFTDPDGRASEMRRLVMALGTRARLFISYKRDREPDEPLATRLSDALEAAGHSVYIDQRLSAGVDWATTIRRQIEACDDLIVLLSAASVQSEMVAEEVRHAAAHHASTGKARIIPVRVQFPDPLPYPLSQVLDRLQYARWDGEGDDEALVQALLDAIRVLAEPPSPAAAPAMPAAVPASGPAVLGAPTPQADPRFLDSLQEPGGAVRSTSEFYVARAEDELLRRELAKPLGTTTTIRAPRQTGKTSLLVHGIVGAAERGAKVAHIDLQALDDDSLASMDSCLNVIAKLMLRKLRLDSGEVDKAWQAGLGAGDKLTYLMEDYVLDRVEGAIVLALDEADRILQTPYRDNFFGLLRAWHNSRAIDERWDKLDLVLVISTEPHLLIKDVNQSPFNVGQKIRLLDFGADQVADLNRRYRSPLAEGDLPEVMAFLHGHPYLTHRLLYTLVTQEHTWAGLRKVATSEQGPFGDHLRRYAWLVHDQADLREALRGILLHGECGDPVAYYRLLQSGLIIGETREKCQFRCELYEAYFRDQL